MALVFDIETVGEDWESFDETTKENLTWWIKESASTEEGYAYELKELQQGLGLSPLTGSVVAIGMYDTEKKEGTVYYDQPREEKTIQEGAFRLVRASEKEMLEHFWTEAKKQSIFVTFNGRAFDAPFLVLRSMVHHLVPTRDLLSNRYISLQRGVTHIDLLDQLTFYGAARFRGKSLHLFCRALGIESPKDSGTKGEDVAALFRKGDGLTIAKYNAGDVRATTILYERWRALLGH